MHLCIQKITCILSQALSCTHSLVHLKLIILHLMRLDGLVLLGAFVNVLLCSLRFGIS